MDRERVYWSRKLEFFIVCIGFTIGLGNVWRFPHLMYSHGGGAFFIPYFICMFLVGIPLYSLELHYGQFTNQGPITIWDINPLFKGLGYSMVILAAVITSYYNVIIAMAVHYLFASMQTPLPWSTCGNQWNTCWCRTFEMNVTLDDPMMWLGSAGLDCSDINFTRKDVRFSSDEYYYNSVLQVTDGIHHLGKLKWDLTMCNLLIWVIIAGVLIKGIKIMGKVGYFSALSPYVLLTFLNIRGITLDGAHKGLIYYLKPDFSKLKRSQVWLAAATQVFFSLSCCSGVLTAMSSYTNFKNNYIKDSVVIPVINFLTSFLAGLAIFSAVGFLSHKAGIPVTEVTTGGPGLIFVIYPVALSQMPLSQFLSIIFFFMIICLGLGRQLPFVETVMTSLQDEFPAIRYGRSNLFFRLGVCLVLFLMGLPQTTQGGIYLLALLDYFVNWSMFILGFSEVIALAWVYGEKRYAEDVYIMVGGYPVWWKIYRNYLHNLLFYSSPPLLLLILFFECYNYKPITGPNYPWWSELLGWGVVVATMISLPGYYIVRLVRAFTNRDKRTETCWMVVVQANQPTPDWGPRCARHRVNTRYDRKRVGTNKMSHYDTNRVNTKEPETTLTAKRSSTSI